MSSLVMNGSCVPFGPGRSSSAKRVSLETTTTRGDHESRASSEASAIPSARALRRASAIARSEAAHTGFGAGMPQTSNKVDGSRPASARTPPAPRHPNRRRGCPERAVRPQSSRRGHARRRRSGSRSITPTATGCDLDVRTLGARREPAGAVRTGPRAAVPRGDVLRPAELLTTGIGPATARRSGSPLPRSPRATERRAWPRPGGSILAIAVEKVIAASVHRDASRDHAVERLERTERFSVA